MITDQASFFQISLNPSMRLTLPAIEQLPSQLPALYGWKDVHSRYIGISEHMIHFSGLGTRERILGKSDRDIEQFHPKSNSYIEWDQVAMQCRPVQMVEKCATAHGEFIDTFTIKIPIYAESGEHVIGVFYYSIPTKDYNSHYLIANLTVGNKSAITLSGSHFQLTSNHNQTIHLTEQESVLLYYYLRGRTSKEIACSLELSKRTIEAYIDKIKSKLDCQTRSQIVDLVIDNDLFDFIPKKLILTLHHR